METHHSAAGAPLPITLRSTDHIHRHALAHVSAAERTPCERVMYTLQFTWSQRAEGACTIYNSHVLKLQPTHMRSGLLYKTDLELDAKIASVSRRRSATCISIVGHRHCIKYGSER